MLEVYHLQKRHPDAGRFRIWSVLGNTGIRAHGGPCRGVNKHL
jgi:hypothetical protein